jgi:HK97 family phage major capsid protein
MPLDKAHELREQRAAKTAEMRSISETAAEGSRELSGDEQRRFDALEAEVRGLTTRITNAQKLEEFERFEAAGETIHGDHVARRSLEGYSLSKALAESRSGGLTGLEAEWHQELGRDRAEVRGVMVPTQIILGGETRALTTGGTGSNMIATDLASMTDRRRAALKTGGMGATVLRGLTGNLELPRLVGSGAAGWVGEHENASRSDASFEKKAMGPKTVSAEYELSRRMLLQANQALEPVLRSDLSYLLAQALDSAALRGGGANEPIGILEDSDVLSVPGGAFSSDLTADLIAALETDDVSGSTGFLTNRKVMNMARKIRDGDGRTIPMSELFHNERVESSTQVPADIGDESNKSALIYGEWASLYIGYWSGVDLLINPYHSDVASKGGAILHAFLDADVLVRHPEGFRYSEIG